MRICILLILLNFKALAYQGIDFPRGCVERKNLSTPILNISPSQQELYSGLYILFGTGRWRSDKPETVRYFSKQELDEILGITITGYSSIANIAIRLCQTLEDQKMQAMIPENFKEREGCVDRKELPVKVIKGSPPKKDLYSGLQLDQGTARSKFDKNSNSRFFSKTEIESLLEKKFNNFSDKALFAIRICQTPEDRGEASEKEIKKSKTKSILKYNNDLYKALESKLGTWCAKDSIVSKVNKKHSPSEVKVEISKRDKKINITGRHTWAKTIGGPLNEDGYIIDYNLFPNAQQDSIVRFDAVSKAGRVEQWFLELDENKLIFYKYKFKLTQNCDKK